MVELYHTLLATMTSFISPAAFLWLLIGSLLAGLVRGFSGFGTAMVFLPFAGAVANPIQAVTIMLVMDLVGPILLVPRTLKKANAGELTRLAIGALLAMPFGILILFLLPPDVFRYMVSGITLILLFCLIAGIRYRKPLTPPMVYAAGASGGFFGGCAGLPGPPVIFLYLASTLPAAVIRATLFVYLVIADILVLGAVTIQGKLSIAAVITGLVVAFSYLLALGIGMRFFNPTHERLYRRVAYLIIAGSAVIGLPALSAIL